MICLLYYTPCRPWTRVDPGGRDQMLALKSRQNTYNTYLFCMGKKANQNGRQPKLKTTKREDDQNVRRPKWNMLRNFARTCLHYTISNIIFINQTKQLALCGRY